MKKKIIIQWLTLTPLTIYLFYCCCVFLANIETPRYTDCGVVISKSNDEVAIKHGSRTELYLNVQFKKTGFKSVKVNPTTYFSTKNGDPVCYSFKIETSVQYQVSYIIGEIISFVVVFGGFVMFLWYLIPDSWGDKWD